MLGVQLNDSYKAYSSVALRERRIVNDVLGGAKIVVLGSAASQGARAYYRGGRSFMLASNNGGGPPGIPSVIVDADGGTWRVTEEFLVNTADQSEKLARLPTHMAFWFGWYQFHPDTELYTGP